MRSYPPSVSRTLSPEDRSLLTVVGIHNNPLSDADVNLIQDLQDWKRQQLLAKTAPSGCLTRSPFQFSSAAMNRFSIPAFDVLFRGDTLRVEGHLSAEAGMNTVVLPAPSYGLAPGRIFVVFLEMWHAALDTSSGKGYHAPDSTHRYFYPGGCVAPDPSRLTLFPDDVVDPGFGRETTERVQLQWRLQVQEVSSDYDFRAHRFGLDPDPLVSPRDAGKVFGQGGNAQLTSQVYAPLAPETGEAALWRAGGDPLNSVQSLDGYVYAMPVAVVFQRTLGMFHPDTAPFGSASASGGGLMLDGVSGRFDAQFADVIAEADVVDARTTTSLTGYDADLLLSQGLTDLMTGQLRAKIGRGTFPAKGLGSLVTHQVGMAPTATRATWRNIKGVGAFDGYRNGISTDERTYFTSKMFVPHPDSSGVAQSPWAQGDEVAVVLPVDCPGVISSVFVQSLTAVGHAPVSLRGSQINVLGLGTQAVRVILANDLTQSPSANPGTNPLAVTVGVTYPAATGTHLEKVPVGVVYGQLQDPQAGVAGAIVPLFGVSDYDTQAQLRPMSGTAAKIVAFAPGYSSSTFGVRVHARVLNSTSTPGIPTDSRVFSVPRTSLDGRFTGLYVTQALAPNGEPLRILSRELVGDHVAATVQGPLEDQDFTTLVILCHRTAQASINPAVMGAVAIEETILFGSGSLSVDATTTDLSGAMDARVLLAAPTELPGGGTQFTGLVRGGVLRGISGDDSGDMQGVVWQMQGTSNRFVATPCHLTVSASSFTLTVPDANLRNGSPWFAVASFLPGLEPSASAILSLTHVPYQGEALEGRDYTVVLAGDEALVTTNGTGSAPVPGVVDVFPYDRQFPVATALPSLDTWNDATLVNDAMRGADESNYTSKRRDNVEVVYPASLRTNDFVPPLQGSLRRKLRFSQPHVRGFGKVSPHLGFALTPPESKNELGLTYATERPITLYVDNVHGDNDADGLTAETSFRTVARALKSLPPILRHPVSVLLKANPTRPYALADMVLEDFMRSAVDGGIYCMASLAFTMQDDGGVLFGPQDMREGAPRVVVDGSLFNTALIGGAAPVAFLISSGRVAFRRFAFTSFHFSTGVHLGAVRVDNADVDLVDCALIRPFLGVTGAQGSRITWTGGSVLLGPLEKGILVSESSLTVDSPLMQVEALAPGSTMPIFFHGNHSSTVVLQNHDYRNTPDQEVAFPLPGLGDAPVVGRADMSSTLIATPTFATQGTAVLNAQSTLQLQRTGGTQFRTPILDATSTQVGLLP